MFFPQTGWDVIAMDSLAWHFFNLHHSLRHCSKACICSIAFNFNSPTGRAPAVGNVELENGMRSSLRNSLLGERLEPSPPRRVRAMLNLT